MVIVRYIKHKLELRRKCKEIDIRRKCKEIDIFMVQIKAQHDNALSEIRKLNEIMKTLINTSFIRSIFVSKTVLLYSWIFYP